MNEHGHKTYREDAERVGIKKSASHTTKKQQMTRVSISYNKNNEGSTIELK